MDILERIEDFLGMEEQDLSEFVEKVLDTEVGQIVESRKSQFVAKLIGMGILEKDANGKLKKVKEVSREEIINRLQNPGMKSKIKSKVRKGMKKIGF